MLEDRTIGEWPRFEKEGPMPDLFELGSVFHLFGHTNIKILMVVDASISTVESPGGFGIGRVARLIDDLERGCSSFTVHTARREPHPVGGGEDAGHISVNFRFDDMAGARRVIDDYDEIWLFGFNGEGAGPVVSNTELRALADWMNKGGGVFATGDHADLGASMCSGIPRVREMRRWTSADGVPPIGGFNRLDTNRPVNFFEATGASSMTFQHERDTTPQVIDWVPVSSFQIGFRLFERPHEILCHPELGPIDVMPDHPHEGRTRAVTETNLARSYDFGAGVSGDDFPSSGANQPKPLVIADGETFAAPPSSKPYKGPAGYFEFPMITIYDGRAVGVKGRVATDSTWHHWFDLNIHDLEHAADDTAWRKISRYFENLAVWLAPPGRFREKCWFIHEWLRYPLVEEFDVRRIDADELSPELGRIVRDRFISIFGPCTTSRFAWDILCQLAPRLCRGLQRFEPRFPEPFDPGPVCLTCPPFELLEEAVFDGIMRATIPFMEQHAESVEELAKLSDARLEKLLDQHFAPAIDESVRRYAKSVVGDLEQDLKTWRSVLDTKAGDARRRTKRR
jgi:hypothetical protein